MGEVRDPSAGLTPLVRQWRGALAVLVIGGGVMAAANAESLGFLSIDFSPGQRTELHSAAPQSDGPAASRPRTPARPRSADPAPSGSAWTASGRVLRIAGADLALDWAGAPPAGSDDKATDDPPDNPEFAAISSPAGRAGDLSAGHSFGDADSIATAAGGGQSGAGGIGSGTGGLAGQAPSASKAPDSSSGLIGDPGGPLQAAVDPLLAAGPVPEPATWASMILGLGLVGAMLRSSRRRRTA